MRLLNAVSMTGAIVGAATICLPGVASATSPLAIASNGDLGAIAWPNSEALNTDTGQICGFSNTGIELCGADTVSSTLATQADGSHVRVFNFTTLTINQGNELLLQGSLPAVLAATGDITIDGSIVVQSGGGAGGLSSLSAPGGTGGKAGSGQGHYVGDPCCGYDTSPGGGGGGKASLGAPGKAGGALYPYSNDYGVGGLGGNPESRPQILSGGGGGAGGNYGCGYDVCGDGGTGGAGAGAVLIVTPGDITIGALGEVIANGARGTDANYGYEGSGGGGAGGAIWFDAGGAWTNHGLVQAVGGAGGNGSVYGDHGRTTHGDGGAGSGGDVFIDPASIVNDGLIDVSDGTGGAANGGHVTLVAPMITAGTIQGVAPGVPEPSTWWLMIMALSAVGATGRARRAGRPL